MVDFSGNQPLSEAVYTPPPPRVLISIQKIICCKGFRNSVTGTRDKDYVFFVIPHYITIVKYTHTHTTLQESSMVGRK